MGEIKLLPPEFKKLIAAGEVVERPANVVKELVENSLDAGATRVEIEILQAGKKLIKVKDNGKGILKEDLPKVVLEGATSKIERPEDLFSVKSYGFRGEALHSIAAVSHLTVRSRHYSENMGAEIYAPAGEVKYLKEIAHPVGTTVEVRDLFFNTPVRLKFLKGNPTERKRITDTVVSYALAKPGVEFLLELEGKPIFHLKTSSVEERLRELFKLESPPEIFEGRTDFGKTRLYLYPNYKSNKFFLFLNGRPIYNRELQSFLKNKVGYKTLAVLFLEIPPYAVDLNVHPRKEEVKFLKERKVFELISAALKREYLKPPTPPVLALMQTPKVSYGGKKNEKFQILGQLERTLIAAYREGFVYFFDQHLLDETVNFELLKDENKACKSSLKAGKKLSKEEMEKLLARWVEIGEPRTCPHGRPVYYKLPLEEIYKKLDRPLRLT